MFTTLTANGRSYSTTTTRRTWRQSLVGKLCGMRMSDSAVVWQPPPMNESREIYVVVVENMSGDCTCPHAWIFSSREEAELALASAKEHYANRVSWLKGVVMEEPTDESS